MARAATRSQKQPTQSQRPSQSQRTQTQAGRSRRANNDDEDEEEEDAEPEEDEGQDADLRSGNVTSDLERKTNDLVRLAIFTEHKRIPLRREDISKKILGTNSRAFNQVFELAQSKLRSTFGMELVELPSRAGLEQESNVTNGNEDELDEARRATGVKKKTAAVGSKTYILRSCLDPALIERAAEADDQIRAEEDADAISEGEEVDQDERPPRPYGSIISWSSSDQPGPAGILYVILTLILVSGRVISDTDLRTHLRRLGLSSTAGVSSVSFTTSAAHRSLPLDVYLTNLQRQGFIERLMISDGKQGKAKGGHKRIRATQADEDDGNRYEWRWGNRALCEVGEMAIAKFVAEFMVGDDANDDEDEDEAPPRRGAGGRKAAGDDKLTKMMAGVERAAGGKLSDLR